MYPNFLIHSSVYDEMSSFFKLMCLGRHFPRANMSVFGIWLGGHESGPHQRPILL